MNDVYAVQGYIPVTVPHSEFATLVTWTGFIAILEGICRQLFN